MALIKLRRTSPLAKLITEFNNMATLVNELKTRQAEVRTLVNELKTDYTATLAKLDLDAGVTDTTYASLNGISAAAVSAVASADANTLGITF